MLVLVGAVFTTVGLGLLALAFRPIGRREWMGAARYAALSCLCYCLAVLMDAVAHAYWIMTMPALGVLCTAFLAHRWMELERHRVAARPPTYMREAQRARPHPEWP